MTTYYTADTHFGHASIIKHCARPFNSADEMGEAMCDNWVATVGKKDEVFHLGDVAFNIPQALKAIKKLPGKKYLVPGNHDFRRNSLAEAFSILPPLCERKFRLSDGQKYRIIMCHYPLLSWSAKPHGSIMLYGHVHGRVPATAQSTDVGVDVWGFAPVALDKLVEHMRGLSKGGDEDT